MFSGIMREASSSPEKCPHCGSKDIEYRTDDYDYDGNDNIHTWDIWLCNACGNTFDVDTNNPYENEED